MSPRAKPCNAVHLSLIALIVATVLGLLPYLTAGAGYPTNDAIQVFEALRGAETAGADISSLVSEYNTLLQPSPSSGSYASLLSRAMEARESAFAQSNLSKILTVIMIPVIAFLLAFGLEETLRLSKLLAKRRMLDQEVGRV